MLIVVKVLFCLILFDVVDQTIKGLNVNCGQIFTAAVI